MAIRPDIDDMINFLNNAIATDPYAISELLTIKVPCNEEMANHPSIQVSTAENNPVTYHRPDTFRLGLLGLLNGYFGTIEDGEHKGWGAITAYYEDGKLIKFAKIS